MKARTPTSAEACAEAGFTLIELLVVLVLIAAISALALPRFTAGGAGTLEQQAETLAEQLGRLRLDAMGSGAVRVLAASTLEAALPTGMRLKTAEPAELVFYPNGGSNGASFELESAAGAVTLDVDWLTGRIAVDGG